MSALKLGLVVAVLFVVAVVNDWSAPDRLIIALVIVLLIAWVWSRTSLQRLGLTRSLDMDRVRAGEWVREEFTLRNHSRLPKLWVELRDLSSLPGREAGRVVRLPGRGTHQWNVSTRCERRGRYRLGPVTFRSGDPLGLFEVRKAIPATHELVVYPPRIDVSDISLPTANMSGGQATRPNPSMAAESIAGIREYGAGDPLSRISWNATARMGRLMVKEFDPDPTSDIWIILDLNEADAGFITPRGTSAALPDEAQEYAIAVAGSLAERCLDDARKVGLIVNRTMPIRIEADGAHRQWFRIFETLAVATSFGHRSMFEAIQADSRRFSRNAGVIVVTCDTATDWVPAARALVQRQVPVTAVLVEHRMRLESGEMDRLAEALVSAHVSTVRLSPGERIVAMSRSAAPALA